MQVAQKSLAARLPQSLEVTSPMELVSLVRSEHLVEKFLQGLANQLHHRRFILTLAFIPGSLNDLINCRLPGTSCNAFQR